MSVLHDYRMESMKVSGRKRKRKGRPANISPAASMWLLPLKEPPNGV